MDNTKNLFEHFIALVPVESFDQYYRQDITETAFFGRDLRPIIEAEERLHSQNHQSVGYFSMEYGLSANTYNYYTSKRPNRDENFHNFDRVFSNMRSMDYYNQVPNHVRYDIPVYSGGLGVLAGDTVKSASDLKTSLTAVGILWNKGYFKQNFWFQSGQIPQEHHWNPWAYPGLVPLKDRIHIQLKKDTIHLRLWKYYVLSHDGTFAVPLIFLDANLPENSPFARTLTDQLYRSDNADWKILQRIILGIGGMKALTHLGYSINTYHLNEGHAALAFIEKAKQLSDAEIPKLFDHFAYTCHTPVAAGHDRFQESTVRDILPSREFELLKRYALDENYGGLLNLTLLAMNTCRHINAVAKKHGEVTRLQFPGFKDRIESITNGVHTHTWISTSMGDLFDRFKTTIGEWRDNPSLLHHVLALKDNSEFRQALFEAHQKNKQVLSGLLRYWGIHPDVFTICWARRIAAYKRPSLILQDTKKLLDIAKRCGQIQILFAGKAHPQDGLGFTYINEMLSAIDSLQQDRSLVRVIMLENYNTALGKLLTSSVDVWLNNPLPPFEASGTSGMKAVLNGVLQLSTLDGWVVEAAHLDIGWIFGWQHDGKQIGDEMNLRIKEDADRLYDQLEKIVRLYYETNVNGKFNTQSEWITKMINAIASSGYFNTGRMVSEYREKIWGIQNA